MSLTAWLGQHCAFARPATRWVLANCRFASYEDFADYVQQIARENPYPFKAWFGPDGRAWIPFAAPAPTGQGTGEDDKVVAMLREEGYEVLDYRQGLCRRLSGGNPQKIGRVLQFLMGQARKRAEEEAKQQGKPADMSGLGRYEAALKAFNNSPFRARKQATGHAIVVSQNPHDVASMSTDRDWTSCMELGEGSHHKSVYCEVREGGLVAYLVEEGDRAIRKPIARIHVRRFENDAGHSVAIPEETVYGVDVPGFKDAVKGWLREKQPSMAAGMYYRRGGEYSDTFSKSMLVAPSDPAGVLRWLRGQDPTDATRWSVQDFMGEDEGDDPEMENVPARDAEFPTKEQAEAYVAENDTQSEREIMGGDWLEEDEDGNWAMDRFRILEHRRDHGHQMREQALERILASPEKFGGTPEERRAILEEVRDVLFNSGRPSGSDDLRRQFIKKFPELALAEEKSLTSHESLDMIKALPEELRAGPVARWKKTIIKDAKDANFLAEGLGVSEDWAATNPRLLESYGWKAVGLIDDRLLYPAENLFQKIPADLADSLISVSSEVARKFPGLAPLRDEIDAKVAHTLGLRDVDTPSFVRFCASLMPRMTGSHPSHLNAVLGPSGPINLRVLGVALAGLGKAGAPLLPYLRKMREAFAAKHAEVAARPLQDYVELSMVEVTPERTAKNLLEFTKQEIERCDWVIEALTTGQWPKAEFRH